MPTTSTSTNLVKPLNIIESNSNDFTRVDNRQDDQNDAQMNSRNVVSTSASYSGISK